MNIVNRTDYILFLLTTVNIQELTVSISRLHIAYEVLQLCYEMVSKT